jgi:hypothetical protein
MTAGVRQLPLADAVRLLLAEVGDGAEPFVVDGLRMMGAADALHEFGQVFPLDPPLVSWRSPDAVLDSLVGGLVELTSAKIVVLVLHSEKVRSAQPGLWTSLLDIFEAASADLRRPPPMARRQKLTVLFAGS